MLMFTFNIVNVARQIVFQAHFRQRFIITRCALYALRFFT